MNTPNIPTMLTPKETAAQCKLNNISLSEYYIKRLCKMGKIPCFKIGRKTLINWEGLINFLNNCTTEQACLSDCSQPETLLIPQLRQVPEQLH